MSFEHQDWHVKVLHKGPAAPGSTAPKSGRALREAKRSGSVETVRRAARRDGPRPDKVELEDYVVPKASHSFKMALQRARQAKGLTRKQLAALCGLKESEVGGYENGRGPAPPGPVVQKLNRVLQTKLPKVKR